jgi:CelD/BcsL family acetyltransferase involved in cellulose biosynthesis
MGYAIEHAIGERDSVFDMLRGEYEYKTQWAPERRQTHFCQAYRTSFPALAFRVRTEWLPALKRRFKDRTRVEESGASENSSESLAARQAAPADQRT